MAAQPVVQQVRVQFGGSGGPGNGFDPLLNWSGIDVGISRVGDAWRLHVATADGGPWEETGFAVSAHEFPVSLVLEGVLLSGGKEGMLFVNGWPITDILTLNRPSEGAVPRIGNRSPGIAEGFRTRTRTYPNHVVRALRRLGFEEQAIVDKTGMEISRLRDLPMPRETASDQLRLTNGSYDAIRVDVFPGDLSFAEASWMLTQTVNRERFFPGRTADLKRAPALVHEQSLAGADYLATIDSQDRKAGEGDLAGADRFLERILGYIVPEESGDYVFSVCGDEAGAFFISSDGAPANLRLQASFDVSTGQYAWDQQKSQQSDPLPLEQGVAYYFEVWGEQNGGGHFLSLAWRKKDEGAEAFTVIPSHVVTSFYAGEPGTFPRRFDLSDPALLEPSEVPTGGFMASYASAATRQPVPGKHLLLPEDFQAARGSWRLHADTGNGLGWIASTPAAFPLIWSERDQHWYEYIAGTANPQWFFNHSTGRWFAYGPHDGESFWLQEPSERVEDKGSSEALELEDADGFNSERDLVGSAHQSPGEAAASSDDANAAIATGALSTRYPVIIVPDKGIRAVQADRKLTRVN